MRVNLTDLEPSDEPSLESQISKAARDVLLTIKYILDDLRTFDDLDTYRDGCRRIVRSLELFFEEWPNG